MHMSFIINYIYHIFIPRSSTNKFNELRISSIPLFLTFSLHFPANFYSWS